MLPTSIYSIVQERNNSMKNIYTPYTYLIGWSEHKKYYYGVRYAKKASPSELWITYRTSSPIVKRFVEKYGDPDIIQVRKIFEDRMTAINWEQKVLRKLDIKNNNKWLNGNIAGAIYKNLDHMKGKKSNMLGWTHTDEAKEKMRKAKLGKPPWNRGRKLTEEHKEKLRKAKENYVPWNKGLTKDDPRVAENGEKISKALKGVPLSESHKEALRKPKRKQSAGFCSEVPADPKQSRCDC